MHANADNSMAQKAQPLGLTACQKHENMYHFPADNKNEAMLAQKKQELKAEGFRHTGEGSHPKRWRIINF